MLVYIQFKWNRNGMVWVRGARGDVTSPCAGCGQRRFWCGTVAAPCVEAMSWDGSRQVLLLCQTIKDLNLIYKMLNTDICKRNCIFQPIIFGIYVKLRGCSKDYKKGRFILQWLCTNIVSKSESWKTRMRKQRYPGIRFTSETELIIRNVKTEKERVSTSTISYNI